MSRTESAERSAFARKRAQMFLAGIGALLKAQGSFRVGDWVKGAKTPKQVRARACAVRRKRAKQVARRRG